MKRCTRSPLNIRYFNMNKHCDKACLSIAMVQVIELVVDKVLPSQKLVGLLNKCKYNGAYKRQKVYVSLSLYYIFNN